MNDDRDKKLEFLGSLLRNLGETPNVDYKQAVLFKEGERFTVKLAKHIIGMANSGGGYLVIGVKEDAGSGKFVPESEIAPEILSSYDPTKICRYVNSLINGSEQIELFIQKIDHDGATYPVIEVLGFNSSPFFVKSKVLDILFPNSLYIRSKETNTVLLASPSQWQSLIDICIEKRQEGLLARFRGLLQESGIDVNVETGSKIPSKKEVWLNSCREDVKGGITKNGFGDGYFEIVHWPLQQSLSFSQDVLLESARVSALRKTGWPIGVVIYNDKTKPIPISSGVKEEIVARVMQDSYDYWQLISDGSFYFVRTLFEDNEKDKKIRLLHFDTRIWRIAEAIDHCIALYTSLNIDPTNTIHLEINHFGMKNRALSASDPMRQMSIHHRLCEEEKFLWTLDVSLDELRSNRLNYIIDCVKKFLVLFDFFVPSEGLIEGVLADYNKSII